MLEHGKFFSETDFDISANIESALADISFSAINLPADFNGNFSLTEDHKTKSREYA